MHIWAARRWRRWKAARLPRPPGASDDVHAAHGVGGGSSVRPLSVHNEGMTTFITRYETSGSGVRLAVKDLIDMEGERTTAGCRAVADRAVPAARDAVCLAGARAAGARIVGRTNLHELALGVTGVNQWYGTPVNPLDPTRVPGGSSSGSAVAVATGAESCVSSVSKINAAVRMTGSFGLKSHEAELVVVGIVAPSRIFKFFMNGKSFLR